jgi:4-carboxymuconolactone decarboxylase
MTEFVGASQPDGDGDATLARIGAGYVELTGSVPAAIETRLALAARSGRAQAVGLIETLRAELIMANPLGRKVGQLVHFAQLLALGKEGPAACTYERPVAPEHPSRSGSVWLNWL